MYHFGNGNQRLNPNGEKNAAVRLVGAMMSFDELHITWEDNAILLPLDGLAQALVQHFDRKGWCVTIAQMEEQEEEKAGITLSLLHGQWMELLEYLAQEPDPEAPVRIIAWDFQQPVLRQRGTLPTKARGGV